MAFTPTPNAVQATIAYQFGNEAPVSNGLWFTSPTITETSLQSLADELEEWFVDNILPLLSSAVEFTDVTVTQKNVAGGLQAISATAGGTEGGAVGSIESMASSLVLTFRTNRIGRAFRGRNYLRGWSTLDAGDNAIALTPANAARTAYLMIPTVASAAGYTWVVRSSQVNGVVLDPPLTTPVNGVDVRSLLMGNQRRSIRRP